MENEDELQLLLGTQFQGIEQARQYAAAMERVARAETKAAESVIKASQAQKELNLSRGEMPTGMGPMLNLPLRDLPPPAQREEKAPQEPRQAPLPMGPHQRLLKAGEDFDRAKESGNVAQIADAHYALRRAQDRVEQAQRGAMSPQAQALYSMRLNLPGGAAPLLGKGLEAVVGKEKTIALMEAFGSKLLPMVAKAGPIGMLASVAVATAKGLLDLSESAAQATNAYTEAQASLGGSVSDVARVQMVGSAGSARSFAERISSDPMAMSAAAQVGVHQMKAPYGDTDFTKGYLQAIERVSKIADASQRRRLALMLGIEQEVARWSLMSEGTRARLKETAAMAARVTSEADQRNAADLKAGLDSLTEAKKNLSTALGNLFTETEASLVDELAGMVNAITALIPKSATHTRYQSGLAGFFQALTFGAFGGGETTTDDHASLLAANTQAMMDNTQAVSRLTQNIGGGSRAREATERLRAFGGATGFSQQAQADFRMGALG